MSNEQLMQAITEINAGNKSKGKQLLLNFLQREPNNEIGWMWLAYIAENDDEKIKDLKKVLEINPQNEKVIAALKKLEPHILEPNLEKTIFNSQNSTTDSLSSEINQIVNSSRSVEFIPANCPNCGGELRVPADRNVVKCMYCGHDVIIHDPNKIDVNLELKFDINKPLKLAKIAEDSKNFEEGSKYYSQVLEHDQDYPPAWFGKARCVAWRTTLLSPTFDEAVSYVKCALAIKSYNGADLGLTIENISSAVSSYTSSVMKGLLERSNSLQPVPGKGTMNTITNLANTMNLMKQIDDSFNNQYYPTIYKTIMFCSQMSPTKLAGAEIYRTITILNNSKQLSKKTKSILKQSFKNIIDDISKKYPDLRKPKL